MRGQLVFLAVTGFGGLVGFGEHFEEFGGNHGGSANVACRAGVFGCGGGVPTTIVQVR